MSKREEKYDVVILTHAPHDELLLTIQKLFAQTMKPAKIIIYNTNKDIFYKNISDKSALEKMLNDHRIIIKHINEDEFDHGKARNNAAKHCKSDFILYLTDDAIPYDDHLAEELLLAFHINIRGKSRVAVTYARQLPRDDASHKEKLVRIFNYPAYDIVKEKKRESELGIKNYFCSNVCAMYNREIFNNVGGFEENIILNEDTFFVYKAINMGYRIVYRSRALVTHSHNLTNREQFSRNFDIGVSQKEHKEIFDSIPSEKEGFKLLKYVFENLIKEKRFIEAFNFIIECSYRYFGYKTGYNFEKLTIDQCINYATNKKYFEKKKQNTNGEEI